MPADGFGVVEGFRRLAGPGVKRVAWLHNFRGWRRHRGQGVCEFAERLVSNRTMGEIADMLEKRLSAPPAGAA